jgi:hypothetical protein
MLEGLQVAAHPVPNVLHPAGRIVKGRAGQSRQVHHADDRFRFARQVPQPVMFGHEFLSQWWFAATWLRPNHVTAAYRSSRGGNAQRGLQGKSP